MPQTPGPWEGISANQYAGEAWLVLHKDGKTLEPTVEDLRVIAAAPELLAEVERELEATPPENYAKVQRLNALIRKAKGKS